MAFVDAQANAQILDYDGGATLVLAGTATKGDILGYDSGWKRALATTGSVVQSRCIALEDGVSGQRVSVAFDYAVVGGARITGATGGNAIYVAEGTDNGKYTETTPTTSGDSDKVVGYSVTPSILLVTPLVNDDSTVA